MNFYIDEILKSSMEFVRLASLFVYILKKGKFRYSGQDPRSKRIEVADKLRAYVAIPSEKKSWKGRFMKNSFLRVFLAEAAHVKNSFKSEAGHLSLPQAGICYIRIPKSASTALCKTLLLARFAGLEQRATTPEEVNVLADIYLERSVKPPKEKMLFFTVVRNPFARIVSVYREYFETGKKPFLYEDYLFGIFRQDFSFQKFIEVLQLIPDRLKDQHLKPQSHFLKYYERRNFAVTIMPLETSRMVDQFLRDRGLRLEEVNRSKMPYDYRAYYDRKTLDVVASLYREDVERFGYQKILADLQYTIEQKHVQL